MDDLANVFWSLLLIQIIVIFLIIVILILGVIKFTNLKKARKISLVSNIKVVFLLI